MFNIFILHWQKLAVIVRGLSPRLKLHKNVPLGPTSWAAKSHHCNDKRLSVSKNARLVSPYVCSIFMRHPLQTKNLFSAPVCMTKNPLYSCRHSATDRQYTMKEPNKERWVHILLHTFFSTKLYPSLWHKKTNLWECSYAVKPRNYTCCK